MVRLQSDLLESLQAQCRGEEVRACWAGGSGAREPGHPALAGGRWVCNRGRAGAAAVVRHAVRPALRLQGCAGRSLNMQRRCRLRRPRSGWHLCCNEPAALPAGCGRHYVTLLRLIGQVRGAVSVAPSPAAHAVPAPRAALLRPPGQARVERRPQPDGGAGGQGLPGLLRQGGAHPRAGGRDRRQGLPRGHGHEGRAGKAPGRTECLVALR